LYAFFWLIPQRLNFVCRRFRSLCLFHLHREVNVPTHLWRWNRQSVPKCRHIKFRRRRITQKKAYNYSILINLDFYIYHVIFWHSFDMYMSYGWGSPGENVTSECNANLLTKNSMRCHNTITQCASGDGGAAAIR